MSTAIACARVDSIMRARASDQSSPSAWIGLDALVGGDILSVEQETVRFGRDNSFPYNGYPGICLWPRRARPPVGKPISAIVEPTYET